MITEDTLAGLTREVCASTRVQPYRLIHKALRVLMHEALTAAGRADVAEPAERAALVEQIDQLLAACADHLAHENRFFHAPLRARAPRAVLAFDSDHEDHLAAIATLRVQLAALRDARGDADAQAHALYLTLSRLVAETLDHMAEEETVLTRALWQHFTDEELIALEQALVASLSPEERLSVLQWMARALHVRELAALLGHAPAEAAPAMLQAVAGLLEPARRQRLLLAMAAASDNAVRGGR